jgi:ABC-2 type transport system permease protein
MNTTVASLPSRPVLRSPAARPMARAVRSEYTKLRTVRANWMIVIGSMLGAVGLAAANSFSATGNWDHMDAAERARFDPTSTALVGVLFGALVLGALAVRVMTTEHTTGMLRTTFAATPQRTRILAAKSVVVVAVTFLAALTSNITSLLVSAPVLDQYSDSMSLDSPVVMRSALFGAVAVSAIAIVGLALGAIFRRASVANIALSLAVIGGQLVGAALPASAQRFLPFNALQSVVSVNSAPELLTPGAAIATLVAEALALILVAADVVRRRDV